jgi:ssDNA thymidine ADP-ribosyltransferase, DarT
MPVPNPVRLFHITAIANLPQIGKAGMLVSKNHGAAVGIDYQNIAHRGAQGTRAIRELPDPPGGVVHDYVPFYFAPRSPMLRAIEGGNVADCPWRQADIVHFETTVARVTAGGRPFAFYDRNATLQHSRCYTELARLDVVAWDLLTELPRLDGYCKYFMSSHREVRYVDRMERRLAEFLVKDTVGLEQMTRVGVIDAQRAAEVGNILAAAGVNLRVDVMRDWYFLGQ